MGWAAPACCCSSRLAMLPRGSRRAYASWPACNGLQLSIKLDAATLSHSLSPPPLELLTPLPLHPTSPGAAASW